MGGTEWLKGLVTEQSLSAGSPGVIIAGTESFIKQQLLSSVQVSATHGETLHHRDTSLWLVMSNSLLKGWER